MGPNETKLQGIRHAKPAQMRERAADWAAALDALYDITRELDVQEKKVRDTWSGGDADAALAAFAAKRTTVEEYQDKARMSYHATMEAAAAVEDGQAKLAAVEAVDVPDVQPAPTGPAPDGETAGKRAVEAYDDAVAAHASSSDARAAALDRREQIAGTGVSRLDTQFRAAQALLSKTVPPPPESDTHGGTAGSGGSGGSANDAPAGAGGAGAGTVVGGTTAAGSVLTSGGRQMGSKFANSGGKKHDSVQAEIAASNPHTSTGADSTPGAALGTGEVIGTGGGGGAAGAAAGAGMLGAGKGIMNKMAGGAKSAAVSAGGRTAGMQKGATIGAQGSGGTRGGASAQGSSAAQGGARSSAAAGQNGGRAASSSQSAAGSRGAAGQGGGRAASGGRASGSGTQAGGRGAGTRAAAATQGGRSAGAGARGGATQGARGGATQGARGGATQGARGAGAGAGRGTGRSKNTDDQSIDHVEFEDDQWIDDDETSPGVIS